MSCNVSERKVNAFSGLRHGVDFVVLLKNVVHTGVVGVIPRTRLCVGLSPRKVSADHRSLHELVPVKGPLKARVILHDDTDILDRSRCVPRLRVYLKLRDPVHIRSLIALAEELDDIVELLALQLLHNALAVGLNPLAHILIGRKVVRRGVRGFSFVVLTEHVNADEVERIAELAASRVRAVMAVRKATVFVDNEAAGSRAALVGVAAVLALDIDLRQKGLDCVLDGVSTAERADDTVFRCRVSLLVSETPNRAGLPARYRPLSRVFPVRIPCELLVSVQPRAVLHLIAELTVRGSTRPVHEPMGLIGGIVAHVNTDVACNPAGNGLILLRRHRSRERKHKAKSRSFRRMTVRAVEYCSAAQNQLDCRPRVLARRDRVHVECDKPTLQNSIDFTAAAL